MVAKLPQALIKTTTTTLKNATLPSLTSEAEFVELWLDTLESAYPRRFVARKEVFVPLPLYGNRKPNWKQVDVAFWQGASVIGAAEFKFHDARDHDSLVQIIGDRLSDLHCVEDMATKHRITTVFIDVHMVPRHFGKAGLEAVKQMHQRAVDYLYQGIEPERLRQMKGITTGARFSQDYTSRWRSNSFGFLFPYFNMSKLKPSLSVAGQSLLGDATAKWQYAQGPVFIHEKLNADQMITIGVRRGRRWQKVPYKHFAIGNSVQAAVCFALFEPGGILAGTTNELHL